MTTDKDDLLDLLRDKENFLNKRVMRNYDDAKKHLRLSLTKDHMADDVIYLAAKTYCDVYDMANDLGLIKNKLMRGEIEDIANKRLSIKDFFKRQECKSRVCEASEHLVDELNDYEPKSEPENLNDGEPVNGYKVRETVASYRNKEKETNDLKVGDNFRIRVGNHYLSAKVVRDDGGEIFVTVKTNKKFRDAKRIAQTVDEELRKFYGDIISLVHYSVNKSGTFVGDGESEGDEPAPVSFDTKTTPLDFSRKSPKIDTDKPLSVKFEKDPLVEVLKKKDEDACVCGNCHPELLKNAFTNYNVQPDIKLNDVFETSNRDGEIMYQAVVRKVKELKDLPNIIYVDAWQGPGFAKDFEDDDDTFIDFVKTGIKDMHPNVAILVKITKEKIR